MNADGLFRGRNEAMITDLTRGDFAKVLEDIGKEERNFNTTE